MVKTKSLTRIGGPVQVVDHPGPHRDSVLLGDVLAEPDGVERAQGPNRHRQVDALPRNVLESPDV